MKITCAVDEWLLHGPLFTGADAVNADELELTDVPDEDRSGAYSWDPDEFDEDVRPVLLTLRGHGYGTATEAREALKHALLAWAASQEVNPVLGERRRCVQAAMSFYVSSRKDWVAETARRIANRIAEGGKPEDW